jgi:DNA-binding PadR family transcriptional regulator
MAAMPMVQSFRSGREFRRTVNDVCEPFRSYGMIWTMSIHLTASPPQHMTATSYLVLGLVEREGPSTPYDLKRHVAATIGHFWSFPHALLYTEPPRLVKLGLLTEERESDGRRRRLFTITELGRAAIQAWLAKPAHEPTELRDVGLLQLFFADLGSTDDRQAIARAQLAIHRAALGRYEDDRLAERGVDGSDPAARTVEHWRGVTLPMGLLYERAAVEFWEGVAHGVRVDEAARDVLRAKDGVDPIDPGEGLPDGRREV